MTESIIDNQFAEEFGKLCNRKLVSKMLDGLDEIEGQGEMSKGSGKVLASQIAWLGKTNEVAICNTPHGDTLVDWVHFPKGLKEDWAVTDWPPRKVEIIVREVK